MLLVELLEHLTERVTLPRTGKTYVVVRPGLGLAMYYGQPLHEIAPAVDRMAHAYLDFIPKGSITALGGANAWGAFTPARFQRQLKQLGSKAVGTRISIWRPDRCWPVKVRTAGILMAATFPTSKSGPTTRMSVSMNSRTTRSRGWA